MLRNFILRFTSLNNYFNLKQLNKLMTSTPIFSESVNPIQEQYLTENCIQVDRNDQIIGPVSKRECHMNHLFSHPLFGIEQNGVEGVKVAAKRKLFHELGIDSVNVRDIQEMGRFIYLARSDPIWVEHELDYALIITNFDAPFKPNPEEVSEVRFVTSDELNKMFSDGKDLFSPWFSLFYKFHWLNSWWGKLDDLKSVSECDVIHALN